MPAGRPTDYCDELAMMICERISAGESLNRICKEPSMPNKVTVFRWLAKHEEFSNYYAQARLVQADVEFDEIEELAATATPETVQIVKLQVDTRKWSLARKSARKYGDKISQEVTGKDGGPIEQKIIKADMDAETAAQMYKDMIEGK